MIDEHKELSRGQFLGIIGGLIVTLFFLKSSSAKTLATSVQKNKLATATGAYGNSSYGGKKA